MSTIHAHLYSYLELFSLPPPSFFYKAALRHSLYRGQLQMPVVLYIIYFHMFILTTWSTCRLFYTEWSDWTKYCSWYRSLGNLCSEL